MEHTERYIEDALVWSGFYNNGCWLRAHDMTHIITEKDDYWVSPYNPRVHYHSVFPYTTDLEEYIGTNKPLSKT